MKPIPILLVDDNPIFLEISTRFIQSEGEFQVIGTATDGREAIQQAGTLRPAVILLDLGMSGMGGLEAIPYLREAAPESAIIALTLLDSDGYRQAAIQAGADCFIPKAEMNVELLPAIRRMVSLASEQGSSRASADGRPIDAESDPR
jgi:DNA-binding NarL/FixJ family response regulator